MKQFDPERPVRVDEDFIDGYLCIHQDDPDDAHPLGKTAIIWGKPVKNRP